MLMIAYSTSLYVLHDPTSCVKLTPSLVVEETGELPAEVADITGKRGTDYVDRKRVESRRSAMRRLFMG